MSSVLESREFLYMWLGFLAAALPGAVAAFVWGLRTGQFRESEHVRRLPLLCDAAEPEGRDAEDEGDNGGGGPE